jgi:hypothetical protein
MAPYGAHESHTHLLSAHSIPTTLNPTLPAQFYHSPTIYALERRAIFSRQWMLIAHSSRYTAVGDFVLYDIADFNFIVLKDKKNDIAAFHNVCRYEIELSYCSMSILLLLLIVIVLGISIFHLTFI